MPFCSCSSGSMNTCTHPAFFILNGRTLSLTAVFNILVVLNILVQKAYLSNMLSATGRTTPRGFGATAEPVRRMTRLMLPWQRSVPNVPNTRGKGGCWEQQVRAEAGEQHLPARLCSAPARWDFAAHPRGAREAPQLRLLLGTGKSHSPGREQGGVTSPSKEPPERDVLRALQAEAHRQASSLWRVPQGPPSSPVSPAPVPAPS